jgi:hypothetical protein
MDSKSVGCGQIGPNESAFFTPSQDAGGSGALNLNSPIGGCAYGMPFHEWTPCSAVPFKAP